MAGSRRHTHTHTHRNRLPVGEREQWATPDDDGCTTNMSVAVESTHHADNITSVVYLTLPLLQLCYNIEQTQSDATLFSLSLFEFFIPFSPILFPQRICSSSESDLEFDLRWRADELAHWLTGKLWNKNAELRRVLIVLQATVGRNSMVVRKNDTQRLILVSAFLFNWPLGSHVSRREYR